MTARRRNVDPLAVRDLTLGTLQRLGDQRARLEHEIRATLILGHAASGLTWDQLGGALGTTGSAAWHLAHPSGTAQEQQEAEEEARQQL